MNKQGILVLLAFALLLFFGGCQATGVENLTEPALELDVNINSETMEEVTDHTTKFPDDFVSEQQETSSATIEDDSEVPVENYTSPGTSTPTENQNSPSTTEPSENQGDQPNETEAGTSATEPVNDETALLAAEYESYINMTGAQQQEFIGSFESIEDFFEWYNSAKAAYDALHPVIDVGDGNVDLGGGG